MTTFGKVNVAVLSSWKQSITVLLQTLRRIKFVVEDTFSFGDFDPQTDYQGMAASGVALRKARYLRIWKFLWISFDLQATLAAVFTNRVTITIPGTLYGASTDIQGCGALIGNAGAAQYESGYVWGIGTQDRISFYRTAGANYTAGGARFTFNGFFEVT